MMKRLLAFALILFGSNQFFAKDASAVELPFPLCKAWVSEFSSFAKEPKRAVREWTLPEASEKKIEAIFKNEKLSDLEKFEQAFDELWSARIASAPFVTRFLMRKPLRTIKNQNSLYQMIFSKIGILQGGAHYHPLFNRIVNDRTMTSGAPEFLVLSHELGHALHRNHSPFEFFVFIGFIKEVFNVIIPSVVLPHMVYRMESFSIGAQYEYIKRIPRSVRKQLIKKQRDRLIKAAELSKSDQELLEAIDNSGVSTRLAEMYFDQIKVGKGKPEDISKLAKLIVFGNGDSNRLESIGRLKKLAGSVKYGRENADELYLAKVIEEILKNGLRNPEKLFAIWPDLRDPYASKYPLFESGENKRLFRTSLKNQMAQLKGSPDYSILENRYHQIFFQSLLYADLPKEEFIKKLRPYHGYDIENLNRKFNRVGPIRILALTYLAVALPRIANSLSTGEVLPYELSLSSDFNFIAQMLQHFFYMF